MMLFRLMSEKRIMHTINVCCIRQQYDVGGIKQHFSRVVQGVEYGCRCCNPTTQRAHQDFLQAPTCLTQQQGFWVNLWRKV
jgi:hypothetical protein